MLSISSIRLATALILGAFFATALAAQDAKLKDLYEAHDWIGLGKAINSRAPAFYRGAAAAAFNDLVAAENFLTLAIGRARSPQEKWEAQLLLMQVYMRAGRYRRAFDATEAALRMRPDDDAGLKNIHALFDVLRHQPEPSTAQYRYSMIRYEMKGGNMFIPAQIGAKHISCLIDSGANFSLISESEAQRLGLKIEDSKGATMEDSSGADVGFRMAIAPRLRIGNIDLRHVFFMVMRDDQQPFAELGHGERVILGLPVLLALKTIRWDRTGRFEIGVPSPKASHGPDLFFEGQQLVASGEFQSKRINVFIDTGSIKSRALPRFASDFPDAMVQSTPGSQRMTGVGDSVEVEARILPELRFSIGGANLLLRPATVLSKNTTNVARYHIWIGMDLLNQPRRTTIDLGSMEIALEN